MVNPREQGGGAASAAPAHNPAAGPSAIAMLCEQGGLMKQVKRERERAKLGKERAEERTQCVVCFDAERSLLFGCSHLAVCGACGQDLAECPICRAPVTSRVRVLIA